MRSLEYLVQLFPDKTGKELLEIQKKDKEKDQREYEKVNKQSLKIVEDIKQNGGYFRGAFGTDQYYMYKIIEIEFDSKQIYCKVEQIVLFDSQNLKTSVLGGERFNFELNTDRHVRYDDITLMSTRIEAYEYEMLKSYLFGVVPTFFKSEWEERQKEFGVKKNDQN